MKSFLAMLRRLLSKLRLPWESKKLPVSPKASKESSDEGAGPGGNTEAGDGSTGPGSEGGQDGSDGGTGLPASDKEEPVDVRDGRSDEDLGAIGAEPKPDSWIAPEILVRQSPNKGSRRGRKIRCCIIHYTVSSSAEGSVSWFENPTSGVSAHFVIGRDGQIYQCVNPQEAAWHAGKSRTEWGSRPNLHSIGIELVNWGLLSEKGGRLRTAYGKFFGGKVVEAGGKKWEEYPEEQLKGLEDLLEWLKREGYEEAVSNLLGHDEIAPGRKIDPGRAFPWKRFR